MLYQLWAAHVCIKLLALGNRNCLSCYERPSQMKLAGHNPSSFIRIPGAGVTTVAACIVTNLLACEALQQQLACQGPVHQAHLILQRLISSSRGMRLQLPGLQYSLLPPGLLHLLMCIRCMPCSRLGFSHC